MSDTVHGLKFPFRFEASGGLATAEASAKIRQNVMLILGTRQGERAMLRQFGTRIASLVHDPNDDLLADLIKNQARDALLTWEPRVLVTASDVTRRDGELTLTLTYLVVTESRAERMVIPLA